MFNKYGKMLYSTSKTIGEYEKMFDRIYLSHNENTELYMYQCGIQQCESDHSWGPGIRDQYIIHYVISGSGTFESNGKTYKLNAGDGFVITPNTIVNYSADNSNPWTYIWIGFGGRQAPELTARAGFDKFPVFFGYGDTKINDYMHRSIKTKTSPTTQNLQTLGYLYLILSIFIEHNLNDYTQINNQTINRQQLYLNQAIEYIEMNYSHEITVNEICTVIGLNRSYLYSIFKQFTNLSPKDYLTTYRISKAQKLLENPNLSIGDISRSIGYEDQLQFSRLFKIKTGLSPRTYRTKMKTTPSPPQF